MALAFFNSPCIKGHGSVQFRNGIIAVLALYALLLHAFVLDANRIMRAGSAHDATIAQLCLPGTVASEMGDAPAIPASHDACAWMCQSGACGAPAPAPVLANLPDLSPARSVRPMLLAAVSVTAQPGQAFDARGPPVLG
jgi:hypothetical protein